MPVQLKLLLATLFWGATPTVGRVLAEYQTPYVPVFGRFFFACIFLSWFCFSRRAWRRIPRRLWPRFAVLGATGILLHNGLLFQALEYTTASTASIILGLIATQVVLLDLILYRRWPDRGTLLGVALGFTGVGVVVTDGDWSTLGTVGLGIGEVLVFCSALCWAIYSVVGRAVLEELPALTVTTVAAWVGLLLLTPFLFQHPATTVLIFTDAVAVGLLFILGLVGTALGFLWYYEAVTELGSVGAAVFINLVPLCGLCWAAVLLDEKLSGVAWFGGGLVLLSLMLVNRSSLSGWRATESEG